MWRKGVVGRVFEQSERVLLFCYFYFLCVCVCFFFGFLKDERVTQSFFFNTTKKNIFCAHAFLMCTYKAPFCAIHPCFFCA